MKRVAVVGFLAACWQSSAAPSPSSPARVRSPSLAGEYRAVETMFVCDATPEDCEETFDDTMKLVELPGGTLHAEIDLIKPVEHICKFEGDFVRAGEHRWTHDAGVCHVELVDRVDVVELSSDGCHFCESDDVLEATFAYPPRRR